MGDFAKTRDRIKNLKGGLAKINPAINKNTSGPAKDAIDKVLKALDAAVTDEQSYENAVKAADAANKAVAAAQATLTQKCNDVKTKLAKLNGGNPQRVAAAQEGLKWIPQAMDAYTQQKLKDDDGIKALRQISVEVMRVNNLSQRPTTSPSYCP